MTLSRWITPRRLKIAFYLNMLIIVSLVGYRSYLAVFEQDYTAVHAQHIQQAQRALAGKDSVQFAVVGNINNSIGIFERKMIPMINDAEPDLLISAGNAVSSGGEDKYRALYRTMNHLEMPYFLTVGEHESSTFGSFHFYDHFGPYFYSFKAGNSQFIFLDSTDPDAYRFQLHWLQQQLLDPMPEHRFVFISHPLKKAEKESPIDFTAQYLEEGEFKDQLKTLFSRHGVTAVFSANLHLFDRQQEKGVQYITTGGAGGLVLNDDTSYYHYVWVDVSDGSVTISERKLDIGQHQVQKTLESLWLFVHSLFYVGHLNFLLVLAALGALAIKLYSTVFVERDYYPNFDLDVTPFQGKPLNIAMVTNNYLPFIGGVPISIDRLRRGLVRLKHRVKVIAPSYKEQGADESDVIRVPSLLTLGEKGEFRIANLLSMRVIRGLRAFKPDLIHIHHPFWLGWLGLILAKRLKVPAVYTYHTRLEHYAHYVPLPGPLFRNLISHSLVRRFANHCEGVIVPTASAEEYLRIIGVTSHIFVQPTGIDFDRFQKRSESSEAELKQKYGIGNEPVLVSVSRLSKEKNIGFIIDGLAHLKQLSDQKFTCLIIGDGEERDALQTRIDEKGLSDCVHLTGAVPPDDMVNYYQLGSLFLFASKSETQGMVILEAMAAHMPVVAVRSSGIDDVVRHGINGYKTPSKLSQWTESVQKLLEDDALREEMADQALDYARRFSIDHFAADVADIYAYVLASYHFKSSSNSDKTIAD